MAKADYNHPQPKHFRQTAQSVPPHPRMPMPMPMSSHDPSHRYLFFQRFARTLCVAVSICCLLVAVAWCPLLARLTFAGRPHISKDISAVSSEERNFFSFICTDPIRPHLASPASHVSLSPIIRHLSCLYSVYTHDHVTSHVFSFHVSYVAAQLPFDGPTYAAGRARMAIRIPFAMQCVSGLRTPILRKQLLNSVKLKL